MLRSTLAPLLGQEAAAQRGPHAERLEERGGHAEAVHPLRKIAPAQVAVPPLEGHQRLERPARVPVVEVGGSHGVALVFGQRRRRLPHPDEPGKVGEVEGPQDERIQPAEDRGVGGEAHRQRHDDQDAQQGAFPEAAQGEANVRQEAEHEADTHRPGRGVRFFLGSRLDPPRRAMARAVDATARLANTLARSANDRPCPKT